MPSVYETRESPYPLFADDGNQRTRDYSATTMQRSVHQESTPLSSSFFGPQNIQTLQTQLRDAILQRTGCVIDRQSDEQLLIIMRAVYVLNSPNLVGYVNEQVKALNSYVLHEAVPIVATSIAQYLGYLKDASQLATPMARPQTASIKGSNTLQYNPF